MTLASRRYYDQQPDKTWLVWLHGFLGNQHDWQSVLPFMQDWPCLTIDLPGHGDSVDISAASFAQVDSLLKQVLQENQISRYIMIGYSLGGRLAMYHGCYNQGNPNLLGLAIEGGNLGLQAIDDKQCRILNDHLWANRFRHQPLKDVLNEWYQQPVFADLTGQQRQKLIDYRAINQGAKLADMLEATSLGCQPWLGDKLQQLRQQEQLAFCYLCGEFDKKFQTMAAEYQLPLRTVMQAGHNAHRANPQGFVQQLISFLKECE